MRFTYEDIGVWRPTGDFEQLMQIAAPRNLVSSQQELSRSTLFGGNNMDTWYKTAKAFDILQSHNYARIVEMYEEGKTEEEVELYCEELVWERLNMNQSKLANLEHRLDSRTEHWSDLQKDNKSSLENIYVWNTILSILLGIALIKIFFFWDYL